MKENNATLARVLVILRMSKVSQEQLILSNQHFDRIVQNEVKSAPFESV